MKLFKSNKKETESALDEVTKRVFDKKSKQGFNIKVNEFGVKYSDLLFELINPYHQKITNPDQLFDLLDIGLVAWNLGNLKTQIPLMYEPAFQAALSGGDFSKEHKKILLHLIERKQSVFDQYSNFIENYELEEDRNGLPVLTVFCQSPEDFIQQGIDESEEEFLTAESANSPGYINRIVITIKPKKPFFDWINNQFKGERMDSLDENNCYLIDNHIEKVDNWIRNNFDKIFVNELDDWDETRKNWPKFRSYKLFCEWFGYETSSMVFDFESTKVSKQ